jgi:hypothetical protein
MQKRRKIPNILMIFGLSFKGLLPKPTERPYNGGFAGRTETKGLKIKPIVNKVRFSRKIA